GLMRLVMGAMTRRLGRSRPGSAAGRKRLGSVIARNVPIRTAPVPYQRLGCAIIASRIAPQARRSRLASQELDVKTHRAERLHEMEDRRLDDARLSICRQDMLGTFAARIGHDIAQAPVLHVDQAP